jgi:hypothetical protein
VPVPEARRMDEKMKTGIREIAQAVSLAQQENV